MFHGESVHTLDAKSRVVVPRRFQEELGRTAEGNLVCILTLGQDHCVYLFSEDAFQRVLDGLEISAYADDDEARAVQRVLMAHTARVELDAAGRVLVPEKLRLHAALQKEQEVVVVGVKDHAEVWAKEAWEAYQAKNDAVFTKVAGLLRRRSGS